SRYTDTAGGAPGDLRDQVEADLHGLARLAHPEGEGEDIGAGLHSVGLRLDLLHVAVIEIGASEEEGALLLIRRGRREMDAQHALRADLTGSLVFEPHRIVRTAGG